MLNAKCAVLATAASRDSQLLDIGTIVTALDPERELSREYRQLIGAGVRQFIVLPKPLPLDTYDDNVEANGYESQTPNKYAALTLHGVYRVTLRRDGRLLHSRAVGAASNRVFDSVLVDALVSLDTSGLLPRPPENASWFTRDTAELLVVITAKSVRRVPGVVYPEDLAWIEPLLRIRVPIHRIEREVFRISGPNPHYPDNLAKAAIPGKVVLQFIVDIDGTVDESSMLAMPPVPDAGFIKATFDAVRSSRFAPMVVAGCPVRTLIEQPFVFLVR
jgi:TonB family protein